MNDQDRISPYNQYKIKNTRDENKEKYQLVDYLLIQYQIHQSIIVRIVCHTITRITNDILGVKRSDLHVTSPYNIYPPSSKQVMRVSKCIR